MEHSRQEHWSGMPYPPLGHLPDSGTEPASPALAGRFFTTSATWEAPTYSATCLGTVPSMWKWRGNVLFFRLCCRTLNKREDGEETEVGALYLVHSSFHQGGTTCTSFVWHQGKISVLHLFFFFFLKITFKSKTSIILGNVCEWVKVVQLCLTLLRAHGLYSPRNSPGQNTGVGSGSLLQGIFPIQGLNPGLPHCRRILYHLSHQGSLGNVLMSVIYLDGIKK